MSQKTLYVDGIVYLLTIRDQKGEWDLHFVDLKDSYELDAIYQIASDWMKTQDSTWRLIGIKQLKPFALVAE